MANLGYAITFARSARKELENLDPALVDRIFPLIESLAQNPRPPKCKKLSGVQNLWRIRIGDYRVVYHIAGGRFHRPAAALTRVSIDES